MEQRAGSRYSQILAARPACHHHRACPTRSLHPTQACPPACHASSVCVYVRVQDQLPADPDARKGWQWNKAKKWVMHIASRLFNRWEQQGGDAGAVVH